MISLFLLIVAFALILLLFKYKVSIDLPTFFKKGFQARRGKFGVYCFCGKQGSGKTFSTVNFILKHLDMPIYSNVHLKDIDYHYFSGFDELLKINDHHCIIVYDEIFTALTKSSRMNTDVLGFLSQMRKKNVIFITTAQEWLEINITLRRYVRYQIDCSIINILPFSILIELYRDGENMKWSNLDNEYVAPVVATKISKMMLKVTQHYDTWEVIDTKNVPASYVVKSVNAGGSVPAGLSQAEPPAKKPAPERTQSQSDSRASFFDYVKDINKQRASLSSN